MSLIVSEKFAEEGGHWYARDGSPAYTMKGVNGIDRPVTLRDARKLNLVPSVTTIIKVAARPGLEKWIVQQTLLSALTLPKIEGESLDAFAARALQDSREQARRAADLGSALHGAIEGAVRDGIHVVAPRWIVHVRAVQKALEGVGLDLFAGEAEKSFACAEGYGGKIDWHSIGPSAVLDLKSKPKLEGQRLAWPEHIMQLAAYGRGLRLANPRHLNVFVGIEDAQVYVHEWKKEEAEVGFAKFRCLLKYWKLERGIE